MFKLFDRLTSEERHFIVKEENMIEVLKMVQTSLSSGFYTTGMSVGNCRWAEEPDSWYLHAYLTNKEWNALLLACKDKGYKLIIKDKADRMFFEKQGS